VVSSDVWGEDVVAQSEELRPKLASVLGRFEGRSFDDALIAEMTDVLNRELAPWRGPRRIHLVWEDSNVSVQLEPAEEPDGVAETCPEREASDEWRSRVRDAEASF
jgi:hypothetical protein